MKLKLFTSRYKKKLNESEIMPSGFYVRNMVNPADEFNADV